MKVALLTREYPPEVYGGAGVHVGYLSRELARLVDVQVHCFGVPRPSPLVARSYQPWSAIPVDRRYHGALQALSVDLLMAAGVEGSDVVHSHTWYANLGGHLASLLHGVPHVVTAHSLEPLRPWKAEQLGGGYAVSSFSEQVSLEAAAAVVAVSQAMRDDLLRVYPRVDPARVSVIHNGIDAEEFSPRPSVEVMGRLGLDPTVPSVVFVGRITRQKGLTHLLRAAPHLDVSAQLVLLASAPDTEAQQAEVSERVRQLRDQGRRVVWIDQALSRQELVAVLSGATVFVCPSIYEPFGLVNLEAMACEVPVVASAVGGIPEIVVDGETGLLVPLPLRSSSEQAPGGDEGAAAPDPIDREGFARNLAVQVNRLLADPGWAACLGRAGRRRVLDRFTWTMVANQTVALYRELLK